jgi:dTDP-4-amino-4,6-dideoxygalactose transaminase
MILTDDDHLGYIASLFLDKCYQRDEGVRNPFFLAPNYQMTELQGAVALAQLGRLKEFTSRRTVLGSRLSSRLASVPGISVQRVPQYSKHSYFLFLVRMDPRYFGCDAAEFATALRAEGVNVKENLITGGRPVYLYRVFQERSAFPGSTYPFKSTDTGADRTYAPSLCPVAEEAFRRWLTMDVLENYTEENVDEIAFAFEKVAYHFARRTHGALIIEMAH